MNYLRNLIGQFRLMSITKLKINRLLLGKRPPINSSIKLMNKIESLKKRIRQRLGLNYIAYMGNPDFNKDWLAGYEQAKKDVQEAVQQIEIYMPYLDED